MNSFVNESYYCKLAMCVDGLSRAVFFLVFSMFPTKTQAQDFPFPLYLCVINKHHLSALSFLCSLPLPYKFSN